ncbi:hypothetical protein FZEAL_4741 [Fusarium zealandicum]|uniref:Uncharacterized protein n=1 Tax=Fusarium zealandicum TaxID=1053134 RepID=A0A8H4UL37_9HYPO|nr:hypothetical protein FZEAL_4741 [Fusarium zealandicum]
METNNGRGHHLIFAPSTPFSPGGGSAAKPMMNAEISACRVDMFVVMAPLRDLAMLKVSMLLFPGLSARGIPASNAAKDCLDDKTSDKSSDSARCVPPHYLAGAQSWPYTLSPQWLRDSLS